jgi:2-dehydro-3-deoxyphosphogluconate aldolase/(4S)-4-hydroxy-2-oxoglutarate aldolase
MDATPSRADVIARLESERLLGIVRARSAADAAAVAEAALDAGLPIIEFTLTTPGALGLIRRFAGGPLLVGVGTVTDPDAVTAAVEAGASFIVTPVATRAVIDACRRRGVAVVCGASTPTEIWNARRWGADLVKVFPIATLGGAEYVRLLRGPLPEVPLVATGGVDASNLVDLLAAGVVAAGLTTALFEPGLVERRDRNAIAERVRDFLELRHRAALPATRTASPDETGRGL